MAVKKLPLGLDNFEKLRRDDFYYIDKTGMIIELLNGWGEVNLFTRPRRFGKSLNMSMLKSFFEIGTDEKLFDSLAIKKENALWEQYMGKYAVISLTLKTVEGRNFEEAREQMWSAIRIEADRHDYMSKSDKLDDIDKETLRNLRRAQGNLNVSILEMARLLYKYHDQKVIILIDEYDVPLQKAEQNGYYAEMINLIRQMFSNGMKSNSYMKFAVITGCLRIAKESIFTGFNNTIVHTIADEQYSEWFGFTDTEVQEMLKYYKKEEYYEMTKMWYDGYHFGNMDVYCPWDVVNWCNQLVNTPNRNPRNYWMNTSGNDIIYRFAQRADAQTRDQLGMLIEGKTVKKKLNFNLTYHTIDNNIENLWSIMFMTGYLTQRGCDEEGYYELNIPNREVTSVFIKMVEEWFTEMVMEDEVGMEEFFEAIDTENAQKMQECLNLYMEDSISFLDGGRIDEKENFYHGLILGMLNSRVGWITKSNREAGEGRLDVVTYPRRGKKAVIFEFKYVKDVSKLESAAKEALRQIKENQYDNYFGSRRLEKIIHYGIAFHKKQCRVLMEK